MFGRRKPVQPIHLYSAGMLGAKREPLTWMVCPRCSYRSLESSYEPAKTCEGRWNGPHEAATMAPAGSAFASRATFEACDGDADLIRRVQP